MFDEVKGQELAKSVIVNQMSSNTCSQSYLFWGDEGVGKRLTARFFAKALNCGSNRGEMCGRNTPCASCSKIERGIHPDVKEVIPDGDVIKKQQISDIINVSAFRPLEGRKRVVIIDSAHKMNSSSANALLKTLEEPPEDTVFILISSAVNYILPTIRSRCQKIRFQRLATDIIVEFLTAKKGISREEAYMLAFYAQGSIGKALSIDLHDFTSEREYTLSILSSVTEGDDEAIITNAQQLAGDKDRLKPVLHIMMSICRDIAVYSASQDASLLIHKDKEMIIRKMIINSKGSQPWEMFFLANDILDALEKRCNVRLALEVLFMEFAECV